MEVSSPPSLSDQIAIMGCGIRPESDHSPLIPQHSKTFNISTTTPRKRHSQCADLLELFEAQRSPTSVTKARRHRSEQLRAMELHELGLRPPADGQYPNAHNEVLHSHRQTPEPNMQMLPKDGGYRTSDAPGKVTGFYVPAMSGLTSIYSDNFDEQDWSLAARPSGFEFKPAEEESSTPEKWKAQPDHAFITSERTTLSGKVLRPRSSLSGKVAQVGFTYQKDRPVALRASTPRQNHTHKRFSLGPSARNQIRQEISAVTKKQRDRFLHHNCSLFLPLLPAVNYVERLNDRVSTTISTYHDIPQPHGVNATMKLYQLKGLSFLIHMYNNGMPAILGDEMGLGKTLQTLSLFQYLKEQDQAAKMFSSRKARPFLVICPLTVLENWVTEVKKFTPELKVLRFHGPVSERELLKDELRKRLTHTPHIRKVFKSSRADRTESSTYDLVITTYEAFEAELGWFRMVCAWRYVVLDEGHRIKNYKSNIAKALLSLNAEYRMILTGTPLQNNLVEMWALFHWLLPEIFIDNTLPLFKNAFDLTKGIVNQSVLDHSRRLLELIMLRRMKSSPGVDLNLPRKDIVRLFVPLTSLQKNWYLRMLTQQSDDMLQEIYRSAQDKEKGSMRSVNIRNDSVHPSRTDAPSMQFNGTVAHDREVQDLQGNTPAKDSWRRLLNLVLQLRKVCTHPYLIPDAAPDVNRIGSHVFENSGKFMALQKLIQELVVHQGKKIIIFSNFTQVLDWVQDLVTYISEDGLKFQSIRLDGNTLRAKRNLYVRLFQQPNSAYKIFLISTKAGGIGLTLTAATEAVFLDEDWNPQVDLQAEARCHRIGQTKPVTIYKLCTSGTVEEQMLGRIHKKLYLSAKITEAMENIHDPSMAKQEGEQLTVAQSKSLFGTYSEFKSLLRRGTQTLAGDGIDTEEMLNWDFETMLKKCQQTLDPATVEEDADENAWLSTMERVECAVFDGQRYARERLVSNGSLMTPSSSRKDRRKGKELTVEIDGYSVNKASLQCGEWEAAPILAGNDPALKDIKRTRLVIQNQEQCQICNQIDGEMFICSNCPRSYHAGCMDYDEAHRAKELANWNCMQHACQDCKKKAVEAGGMIFRCRWCARGYCEDCLDWDACDLIGDSLDEYKVLGFPEKREAYYVVCPECSKPELRANQELQAELYRYAADCVEAGGDFDPDAPVTADTSAELKEDEPEEDVQGLVSRSIEADPKSPSRIVPSPTRALHPALSASTSATPGLTSRATSNSASWTSSTPFTPPFSSLTLNTPLTSPSKRKAHNEHKLMDGSPTKRQKKGAYEIEI